MRGKKHEEGGGKVKDVRTDDTLLFGFLSSSDSSSLLSLSFVLNFVHLRVSTHGKSFEQQYKSFFMETLDMTFTGKHTYSIHTHVHARAHEHTQEQILISSHLYNN